MKVVSQNRSRRREAKRQSSLGPTEGSATARFSVRDSESSEILCDSMGFRGIPWIRWDSVDSVGFRGFGGIPWDSVDSVGFRGFDGIPLDSV